MAGRRVIVTLTPSSPCSAALFGVHRSGVSERGEGDARELRHVHIQIRASTDAAQQP
jgi:hypothetical protein